MDTEEFLIKAEDIALQNPEDELAVRFLSICNGTIQNEAECMELAAKVILKLAK